MKIKQRQATAMMALLCTVGLEAQVLNNAGGDYRLTLNTGNNAPRSFTIGSAFSPVGFMSALTVRGDQMGGTSVTPEVFRTNAPTTANTYWRMFQGGTTAGFERGQLFAEPANTNFNINAPNGHLRLYTNTIERMRLNGTGMYTIGTFANQNADGYLGLSPNNTLWNNGPGPFSRLHLHDGLTSVLAASYRPWMDNGITFTTNSDQMYVGHKVEPGTDQTSAVIQWGDNAGGGFGPDVLKFIFSEGHTGASTGPASINGQEMGRFHPWGLFGLGDFQAAGQQPTERLDLLTGRVRIRQLAQNNALTRYVVSDADGVLHWRDLPAGGTACEWTLQGPPGSNSNIATAYAANPGCPQADRQVGIGTNAPDSKLHVVADQAGNTSRAGRFIAENGHSLNTAVSCIATATGAHESRGVNAQAIDGELNSFGVNSESRIRDGFTENSYGVRGYSIVENGAGAINSFGVDARSQTPYGTAVESTFGVRGRAGAGERANHGGRFFAVEDAIGTNYGVRSTAAGPGSWAGWFDGDVTVTGIGVIPGGVWQPSAAQFKTNVQPLTTASTMLSQLQPRSYDHLPGACDVLGLPAGTHAGFIAHELEQVIPQLVREITYPEQTDTAGITITAPFNFKVVNYTGLIPYLVAGLQEQQVQLADQQQQLSQLQQQLVQMQQQLAQCCASTSPVDGRGMLPAEGAGPERGDKGLRIQPNPFGASTEIVYHIERAAQVRLEVADAQGRLVQVLHQGQQAAGEHRTEWNTAAITTGQYLVRLVVDGEQHVEQAVRW